MSISVRYDAPTTQSDVLLPLLRDDASGAIHIDLSTTVDGPLLDMQGENGSITLAIVGGRIHGYATVNGDTRVLDAEDTRLSDGYIHSIALSSNSAPSLDDDDTDTEASSFTPRGMHLFFDGYEAFTTSLPVWCADIELTSITINPRGVHTVSRVVAWSGVVDANTLLAYAHPPLPLVEFAGCYLDERDTQAVASLREGTVRATFRTRGRGQGGVILSAGVQDHSSGDALIFGIDHGNLFYEVHIDGTTLRHVAPGHWDDGVLHTVALSVGHGAIHLSADGYEVLNAPGSIFFSDLAEVKDVVVGTDLHGTKLFGEVSSAEVYPCVLTDHQIKRLAGVEPLPTQALFDGGMLGAKNYRIPSIITLASGTLLAGADQRVSIANDSPNDINFVLRRSRDNGRTWTEPRVLVRYPGSGPLGASVIDSVLVEDRLRGRVFVFLDQFPGGIGQPNAQVGTGFTPEGDRIVHDLHGTLYSVDSQGIVRDREGQDVGLRVDTQGNVTDEGNPRGNIYLSPGEDPNESLFQHPSCHMIMMYSDDEGETWSEPRDITAQIKEEWMRFCGTSPGNGIQLLRGAYAGRLLVPMYYNHEEGMAFSCAAIYSDDGGTTWTRGASPNDGRMIDGIRVSSRDLEDDRAFTHESVLVEGRDGLVHVWMRNQHPCGRVAHATSADGGETWGEVEFVEQIPEIFSQPNAIRVDTARGSGILFANASQLLPFRGRGEIRLSFDDGQTWPHNRVFNPRHYVYQCMTQLATGDIALLWERELQGLFLTIFPLSWLEESRSTMS